MVANANQRAGSCNVTERYRHPLREPAPIEHRQRDHDRQQIEKRQVSAQHQQQLEDDGDRSGDTGKRLRQKERERDHDFDKVIECHSAVQRPPRQPVKIPAQRIRDRLGFIVIIETGEIAPTGVAAQFDETGAEHDAELHPSRVSKAELHSEAWMTPLEKWRKSPLPAA